MQVLYFAWVRTQIGTGSENIDAPCATVQDLIDFLCAKGENYALAFHDVQSIKVAVNQEFTDFSCALKPTDEVAFFPPVTGG